MSIKERPCLADPLLVAVTLTNLRGVPYKIDFQSLTSARSPYVMTMHADAMTFAVGRSAPPATFAAAGGIDTMRNAIRLDIADVGSGDWLTLRTAALATGAFPFGLAPRALKRLSSVYAQREWYFPNPRTVNGSHQCGYVGRLDPFWDSSDFSYDFLTVDGGTMDNEPVGLARGLLTPTDPAGTATAHPATPAALVMIDPFPDADPFDTQDDFHRTYTLLKLAPKVLRALISQSRFKPDELTRAIDPTVYNQYLLAPVRYSPSGEPVPHNPIACGGLGGFAGFLSRDFRAHDFQLGRLNAQRFLRSHFVLPETLPDGNTNPLFAGWTAAARSNFRVFRDDDGWVVGADRMVSAADGTRRPPAGTPRPFLPVIPLYGRAAREEPFPTWPGYLRDRLRGGPRSIRERFFGRQEPRLRERVADRLTRVVDRMVETTNGWFTRRLLFAAWRLKRDDIIDDDVIARIEKDLSTRGLLRG